MWGQSFRFAAGLLPGVLIFGVLPQFPEQVFEPTSGNNYMRQETGARDASRGLYSSRIKVRKPALSKIAPTTTAGIAFVIQTRKCSGTLCVMSRNASMRLAPV